MATHGPLLIAVDVGNINTKLRREGGAWTLEPSLVRLASRTSGFSFSETSTLVRPLIYHSGPAGIEPGVPYIVGHDAERTGSPDLALVGSTELRAQSAAYYLLHLSAIIASLPPGVTTAEVVFAGGLPVDDHANVRVKELVRERLTGKGVKGDLPLPHVLSWGDVPYTITITRVSLVPQPIGAISTLLFTSDGRVQTNGALLRQRYALDIGGGTTDFTGRAGLELIPGTEGGIQFGMHNAAELARGFIQQRFPRLRHLDVAQIVALLRSGGTTLHVGGEPNDVGEELGAAVSTVASAILTHVLPLWERTLAQGEVLLFGGGGQAMAAPIGDALRTIAPVTLLPNPLFRVADGIERLARYRLSAE
jgi:hypothetical protein